MGVYGRLLHYVSQIKGEIAVKVLLGLGVSATYLMQAVVMAMAVTHVFAGGTAADIKWHLILALIAVLARGLLSRSTEAYGKVMAARIKGKIRALIFDKVLKLGPGYFGGKRSGKVSSLVLDGIESLEPFFVNYVPQMITVAVTGITVGVYLCFLDMATGLVVVASMVLCVVIPYLTVPLISPQVESYWRNYSVLTSQYLDSIQGMTTLKAFNASAAKGSELMENATTFYKRSIKNTSLSLINSSMMLILTAVVSSVTVVVAAFRTDIGIMPVTAVSAFLFLAAECARPMTELGKHWHSSFLGLSVAKELFEIVDREPDIQEKELPDRRSMDESLPGIRFQDVSFAYREGSDPAVKGITLDISPGMTAAFVGRSGSGKSTILNLLLRFYDAKDGRIAFNGIDIRDYSIDYLQSKMAVVFQDTYLFGGTIAENIRMANQDATDREIIAAAKAANAHEFIVAMPNGYDSIVGERGATLSGGQKQRISIARAFLKNAPILILDEATSSVDAKSEVLIQQTLDKLMKDRTTIIIAHRLSTIQNADRIFVLDNGRLAEQGAHEELLRLGGVYSELIHAQRRDNDYA